MTDDPFERAAQREARMSRLTEHGLRGRPLIGLQLAWGVLLALHWWIASGEGLGFAIHAVVFILGLGFTIFAVTAMSVQNKPRWGLFSIAAGWLPLLVAHWAFVDDRDLLLTLHASAFALLVAVAVLAVFAIPSNPVAPDRRLLD